MASTNSNRSVSLSSFPSDRRDALAILYMQNQDLSEKTPEELVNMYNDAWEKISEEFKSIREKRAEERRKSHGYTSLF